MGVQSIWLLPPCSLFCVNPPLVCMDPSRSGESRALKTERKKSPGQSLSDHAINCYYFKKRNTEAQTESPCSVRLPAANSRSCLSSFLRKERARKWMTSEDEKWVAHPRFRLKVTLQFSVVQRCFYYYSFNLFFFSFVFLPLKLNDKLWNFVVCLFLMWVLKNDNAPNACDRAFPPPAPSSLPISCCGSSSRLAAPSFQNILVSVLRPSLSFLAAVCFAAWSVFAE